MLLLAQLCGPQGGITATCCSHELTTSPTGAAALALVASAVLGPSAPAAAALNPHNFITALATSTTTNVLAARHLCLAALGASLAPSNCFTLLAVADAAGVAPLRDAAERVCLACVPAVTAAAAAQQQQAASQEGAQAMDVDPAPPPALDLPAPVPNSTSAPAAAAAASEVDVAGFRALPQPLLERLLSADGLQVASEMDVFQAVEAWAAPAARADVRGALVRSCVRLSAMSVRELEALDQSPAVLASMELTRIVAQAYVMCIMGVRGLSGPGPRPSVLAAQAAAAEAAGSSGGSRRNSGDIAGVGAAPVAGMQQLLGGLRAVALPVF
ncbi:hypothetical protein HXX76_006877 [Chlamydomonas incerta]|uniref:BACK domain-containing protein n=1 Tax=Chlamydomonas incerta TaxID=51695 RepID=A0A835T1M5_CHLIN|nr:hypothetical protein HXX76_006877 [Chlamydomonas incerta]|eukprot:KAG2435676.1 hypothetical protein HXX76_006877 [Chlamydomonas incerta]